MSNGKKYDVAFSYAGEDREFVEQVAKFLINCDTKVLESTEFLTCFYSKNRMPLEGCHHISRPRHRFGFQTAASDLHQALLVHIPFGASR